MYSIRSNTKIYVYCLRSSLEVPFVSFISLTAAARAGVKLSSRTEAQREMLVANVLAFLIEFRLRDKLVSVRVEHSPVYSSWHFTRRDKFRTEVRTKSSHKTCTFITFKQNII